MFFMKVAIIMGSIELYPIVREAEDVLRSFGISTDTRIMSAHRTPKAVIEYASKAEQNGIDVIIAASTKAAHLAGVFAALVPMPVIALPMNAGTLDGLDALLAMVQMPKGVPVATVTIDGAENAGLLAVQMLSIKDPELREKVREYKEKLEKRIVESNAEFQKDRFIDKEEQR
jgi:5-(carboxyamino)imidazole ribonucleotide mutase